MNKAANLTAFLCIIIISSLICAPLEKSEDETKRDSSQEESKENDSGIASQTEKDIFKEKGIENREEDVEKSDSPFTLSPKEEKENGEDLPEKNEEAITKHGELDNLISFTSLFDEVESETSENEEEQKPISPEEMKKMKEDIYHLVNENNDLSKISQEDFDQVWKEKKEKYGEKFPRLIEKLAIALKKSNNGEGEATSINPNISETTTFETEPSKEEAPKDAFALRNAKGKICILAKFHSALTINYEGKSRDQTVHVSIPSDAHVKGKCGSSGKSPVLQLAWEKFSFEFLFEKDDDSWYISKVEFSYDTSEPLFDGAANPKKIVGKSKKSLFETPLGKSYFCPAKEVLLLFSNDEQVAVVELKDVHIQPYDVEGGKFSANHRCDKVVIGGLDDEPFVQDETVPLAVGLTLALITLLVLVGFSVHRAYMAARVDYNNMDSM